MITNPLRQLELQELSLKPLGGFEMAELNTQLDIYDSSHDKDEVEGAVYIIEYLTGRTIEEIMEIRENFQ